MWRVLFHADEGFFEGMASFLLQTLQVTREPSLGIVQIHILETKRKDLEDLSLSLFH